MRSDEGTDMDDEQIDSGRTTNIKGNLIVIGVCVVLGSKALLLRALFY